MNLGDVSFTSWAGLMAAGAIIASTWRHILTFARYVTGVVIGTSILKDDASEAVMAFSMSNSIKSPLGSRMFGGFENYVHPKRHSESVAYEGMTSDPVIIKFGRQYAMVSLGGSANSSSGVQIGEFRGSVVQIKYLRWFFDIEKFVLEAIDYYNYEKRQKNGTENTEKPKISRFKIVRCGSKMVAHEKSQSSQYGEPSTPPVPVVGGRDIDRFVATGVYRLLKWKREDLQIKPEDGQSPFTGFPFPKTVASSIVELDCWLKNEKWFRSKSIPWRRGWLLYGIPGTGKSTLVRAIGMSFNLPVYIFDLVGMTNNDLVGEWDNMMSNTPCIALIEDIDAIFKGREYVGGGTGINNIQHVTFDCLLNCISGVKKSDGVFLIVTTNHIEYLDPALGIPDASGKSSRPGRIDRAIHLGIMEEPERKVLAEHILSDFPDLIEATVKEGDGETAAQFQNRCAQLALSRFWESNKAG